MSMVAMIYFVFFNINMMAFYGITGFSSFLSILDRVGDVLSLEEVKISRDT